MLKYNISNSRNLKMTIIFWSHLVCGMLCKHLLLAYLKFRYIWSQYFVNKALKCHRFLFNVSGSLFNWENLLCEVLSCRVSYRYTIPIRNFFSVWFYLLVSIRDRICIYFYSFSFVIVFYLMLHYVVARAKRNNSNSM